MIVTMILDRFHDCFEALTKQLTLNPGCAISYQRHTHRDETWTFINGEGILILEDERRPVRRGETVHILKGQRHALKAVSSLTFIEVQTGIPLIEEDIERFPLIWQPPCCRMVERTDHRAVHQIG